MPCKHELCMPCFKQNVQEANFTCPMCRIRISTWARRATRENKLIDMKRWKLIKKSFPEKVRMRQEGIEDDNLSEEFPPEVIHISRPGEIRREYELQMKKLLEEKAREREEEAKASEKLIQEIEHEEKQVAIQIQKEKEEIAARDEILVKELCNKIKQQDDLDNTVFVEKFLQEISEQLPQIICSGDSGRKTVPPVNDSVSLSLFQRSRQGVHSVSTVLGTSSDCMSDRPKSTSSLGTSRRSSPKSDSNSWESYDSIKPEMTHFRPIKIAPRTPPKRLPSGKFEEPKLVRTKARKLDFGRSNSDKYFGSGFMKLESIDEEYPQKHSPRLFESVKEKAKSSNDLTLISSHTRTPFTSFQSVCTSDKLAVPGPSGLCKAKLSTQNHEKVNVSCVGNKNKSEDVSSKKKVQKHVPFQINSQTPISTETTGYKYGFIPCVLTSHEQNCNYYSPLFQNEQNSKQPIIKTTHIHLNNTNTSIQSSPGRVYKMKKKFTSKSSSNKSSKDNASHCGQKVGSLCKTYYEDLFASETDDEIKLRKRKYTNTQYDILSIISETTDSEQENSETEKTHSKKKSINKINGKNYFTRTDVSNDSLKSKQSSEHKKISETKRKLKTLRSQRHSFNAIKTTSHQHLWQQASQDSQISTDSNISETNELNQEENDRILAMKLQEIFDQENQKDQNIFERQYFLRDRSNRHVSSNKKV
ncbi:uncharacterized protein LOC143232279 [Tachypleus tridentatus]|uniref:uncharacterized protein LOC143232279 n=1 Tax=Tachypleus tridentatus TaxID=6853 RepID=UPI003FD008DE